MADSTLAPGTDASRVRPADVPAVDAFVLTTAEVDGAAVVSLAGELDIYTAPRLRDVLNECTASGPAEVIVDLSEISFIDSTGIGVLVGAYRRLGSFGKTLALRAPSSATYKVLEITGLVRNLPIIDASNVRVPPTATEAQPQR